MNNKISNQIIEIMQDFYKNKKSEFKLVLRGEELVLLYLFNQKNSGVVTPSDLSEILDVSTARIATSLNSLQAKELVTREIDPIDRRKIIISLTEKGTELSEKIIINHHKKIKSLLDSLGENDTQDLLRILKKIQKIVKEENIAC